MENTPQTLIIITQSMWDELTKKMDAILEKIEKRNQIDSEWIESSEARKMLGVSQKTWQTYRDNRIIPFAQFGRKIYVKRADLEAFMQAHYIKARETFYKSLEQ